MSTSRQREPGHWMDLPRFRDRDPQRRETAILPGALRFKFAAPFVVLVAVVLIALSLFLGFRARSFYVDRLSDQLGAQAFLLGESLAALPSSPPSTSDVQTLVATSRAGIDARITIVGPDGVVIADSDADPNVMNNHNTRPEIVEARRSGLGESERKSVTFDQGYLYVAVPMASPRGYIVRMSVSLEQVSAIVSELQRYTLGAAGFAIALTIAIAWFIAGRIATPLDELRLHAHAVAAGDLGIRVRPAEMRELAEVGFAFNTMVDEVQTTHSALEQTRVRLEAVLGGLDDGVVLTDSEGIVLRMNRAAEHILNANGQTAVGRPFLQVSRDYEIHDLLAKSLLEDTHTTASIEHGLNRRTLLTSANVIEGSSERMGLVVLRDVSELRRLESVRREFVANVSHELRTPLTSIRAMVETLESGVIDDRATSVDFLGRIVGEVDRLTALVEDLLDLARLEAGRTKMNYERLDPLKIVGDGADRLRAQVERAQLKMTVTSGDAIQPIMLDRTRIEQVLVNLVHNAIKFTPPEGSITIDVQQADAITSVTVRDTGIGIAVDDQDRLFERFYKSDRARTSGGTGLGLAIVKHIVQSHGGEISVVSKPGEGSAFTFSLPNARPQSECASRPSHV